MAARTKSKCACGARLPVHLVEIMNNDTRHAHVCSCERRYVVKDEKFVQDGTQVNPFARYDATHSKGSA